MSSASSSSEGVAKTIRPSTKRKAISDPTMMIDAATCWRSLRPKSQVAIQIRAAGAKTVRVNTRMTGKHPLDIIIEISKGLALPCVRTTVMSIALLSDVMADNRSLAFL